MCCKMFVQWNEEMTLLRDNEMTEYAKHRAVRWRISQLNVEREEICCKEPIIRVSPIYD